jgi:hypothetical protein
MGDAKFPERSKSKNLHFTKDLRTLCTALHGEKGKRVAVLRGQNELGGY